MFFFFFLYLLVMNFSLFKVLVSFPSELCGYHKIKLASQPCHGFLLRCWKRSKLAQLFMINLVLAQRCVHGLFTTYFWIKQNVKCCKKKCIGVYLCSVYPLLTLLLCFKFHPVQYDLSSILCYFMTAVGWTRRVTIAAIFMCKLSHEMLSPSLQSPTHRHSISLRRTSPLRSSSTSLLIH